jgi:tetratricopeptide (TPR) repeat protein
MTESAPGGPHARRALRVFVSSTFSDMQAERDELAKRIFPSLRRLCQERGVTWTDVDLRWGIPSEEAADGGVLPLCFAEIDRCRPYFICLLGERYGFVPPSVPDRLVAREPWLADVDARSITELEIAHGVLRTAGAASRAFFYFRDPQYANGQPPELGTRYRETPTVEDIGMVGIEEAERRCDMRRRNLARLKEAIRSHHRSGKAGCVLHEDYTDPSALGALVLEDFTGLIDELFPPATGNDPLARDEAAHEAFAAERRQVYVPREGDLARLDAFAGGRGGALAVVGDAGIGKTALLANWAQRHRARDGDAVILQHYAGATVSSTDWAATVRRLAGTVDGRFALGLTPPEPSPALREFLGKALQAAAVNGRVVLVIDGLDQLEDRDNSLDLVWLPAVLPAGVSLIVSTGPGRPLDELTRRGWPLMTIGPLSEAERRALIEAYIHEKHGGRLAVSDATAIASAPHTGNPLYLRTLLEELRVFGIHEQLPARIGHYLAAPTLPALFALVLARWEADYERDRPGLVGQAMRLLWAARRGLSEGELLDLLGTGGNPLPRAHWAPLHDAAWESLAGPSGLLGFSHGALRDAVASRYLATADDRRLAHAALARYFATAAHGVRRAEELPWHQADAGEWEALAATLSDLELVSDVCRHDAQSWLDDRRYEWSRLWRRLGDRADPEALYDRALQTFLQRKGHSHETRVVAEVVGLLLEALGRFRGSTSAFRVATDITYSLSGPGSSMFVNSLNSLASQYKQQGRLREATALYRQAAAALEDAPDPQPELLAAVLNNLAMALFAAGRPDEARAPAERSLGLRRQHLGERHPDYAISLDNLAAMYSALGDRVRAIDLHDQALELLRQTRGPRSFDAATVHANLGMACLEAGRAERAQRELEAAIAIYRELLGDDAPVLGVVHHNLATLHQRGGAGGAARRHYAEALRIQERAHGEQHAAVARSLLGLAVVSLEERRVDEGRALLTRAARIASATMEPAQPERMMIQQLMRALESWSAR